MAADALPLPRLAGVAELRARLTQGLSDMDSGNSRPAHEVFAELESGFQK